ncbi:MULTISPECIES: hypothetical protein [Microbacterium]|uniref:hypothetical protein n=1 Tax=Microbacterium TaxID=33882 RepID=UPI0028E96AB2|nr:MULTISPECIES: hypothetical protein [Microbacterium]
MITTGPSPVDGVRRAARLRGVLAILLGVMSVVGVLVTLDLWTQTMAPAMLSLPSNLLLTAGFGVATARSFALSRRGGHTESSAAADRLIALAGLIVVFAMVFSALTAVGAEGWLGLVLYAVVLTAALETLLLLTWKARPLAGDLRSHRPIGERRR